MALELNKLTRGPHLSTLVASSIAREITQGRLRLGDKLPTEQSLATTFGVSRNVVREAIARLRSEGRISSQQGRGAFVSQFAPATALTISHEGIDGGNAFLGLFELRGLLEVEGAELAARRRRADDVEALRKALGRMEAAPYGGVAWLEADLDFHRLIAAATRNVYIGQVLVFVSERVRDSILASGHVQGAEAQAQMTLSEHRSILDAIAAADPPAAKTAMRIHLDEAAKRVGLDPAIRGIDGPAMQAAPKETALVDGGRAMQRLKARAPALG